MGIPFLITSIFPKKQFCFTPNSGFLYCFRFIPRHTREHGYPKRKHKSQKNETDIALKNAPFLEDTFLFQVIRKIDDCVNRLIISLLEESRLENLPDSKSSNWVLLKFWYIYVSKFEETFICKREIDALPPIIRFAVFILLTEPSRIPLFNLLAIELLMAE